MHSKAQLSMPRTNGLRFSLTNTRSALRSSSTKTIAWGTVALKQTGDTRIRIPQLKGLQTLRE